MNARTADVGLATDHPSALKARNYLGAAGFHCISQDPDPVDYADRSAFDAAYPATTVFQRVAVIIAGVGCVMEVNRNADGGLSSVFVECQTNGAPIVYRMPTATTKTEWSFDSATTSWVELPAAGATPFLTVPYSGISPAGGTWYDIQTWQGEASPAGLSTTVGFIAENASTILERLNIKVFSRYGAVMGTITPSYRAIGWPDQEKDVRLRVISETSDLNGPRRLQIYFNSTDTFGGLCFYEHTRAPVAGSTFGTMVAYTPTGNEVVITEAPLQTAAWIDHRNESVRIYSGEHPIADFAKTGTRFSEGSYGSWQAPFSTVWPIDASFWTNLICEKRTDPNDTLLNPSSTVTLTGVDAGGVTAATMTGFDGGHRGLRFGTAGSGGVTMTFAGCFFQRVIFQASFGVATTSGGVTQDYEVVDSNGTQVAEWTIPASGNNVGSVHIFNFEFESGDGDSVYTIRKRSTGTSQTVYMYNYTMTVAVDEPAKDANAAVQIDSPKRGLLLPRNRPKDPAERTRGLVHLDATNLRPVWDDGEADAYINTTRPGFRTVDQGQFFFAESGTFAESGWTGSTHARLVYTEDFQGFPAVIRCTQSGGTITIQGPDNTAEMWATAKANGFRVDHRMMFGATFDGSVWIDIEPNNTSWGANGRFEYNVTVNAGQLQITMINSGGNTTFDIERDVMHTISMIYDPVRDVAEVWVEGRMIGEVTYGGTGSTERGTFHYIPPGNPVNDFCFQSITTYALPAADLDVTLTALAVETGYRYNIPNISQSMRIRTPKGNSAVGNTFTIVNGSTEPAIVSGQADDHQLIGGVSEFEIPPNNEVTFTQSAFPRGCVWAVSNGKTVTNHGDIITPSLGNTLKLTIDASGNIVGRHGNYLGTDVSAVRTSTGKYTITVTSALFDDTTTVFATPKHTAGQQMTANYAFSLGEVIVDILQAGALVNDSFCVEINW